MRILFGIAVLGMACAFHAHANVVLQLRLRSRDVASDGDWEATRKMIAANPGCCDEVWFSTGIGTPPLSVHAERAARVARAAEALKSMGIVPSLQFQATIGHGDNFSLTEDCSFKTWTGWTGSTGVEAKACHCPRQSGFLGYVRRAARLYAAFKPAYVWIDDDLRIDNHAPATIGSRPGCWCSLCLSAFNESTGGAWTRQSLDAAMKGNDALLHSWMSFSEQSLVEVARAIAEEFRRVSPRTRMALQHGMSHTNTIKKILRTLHDVSGQPVGFRPGGGAYYDINPHDQVVKSLCSARFRRTIGDPPWVSVWTPEIESWPRVYGSRSAQSVMVEAFVALMYGMDAASMLVTQTGHEARDMYARTLLAPLAQAAPVLKGYAAANGGTVPAGFDSGLPVGKLYGFACSGVPVLFGVGKPCGELTPEDVAVAYHRTPSAEIQEMRAGLDRRGRGAPAQVASPFVGLMLPRVSAEDGTLRTVALVNVRIDRQESIELVLRNVSGGAKATWHALRRAPVALAIRRDGDVARVVVPGIDAWNAGYVEIRE